MHVVGCPECGAPAELESWSSLPSTGGRMEHVKLLCIRRHWFLMPRESLPEPVSTRPTGRRTAEDAGA
jgi:hypothetical protein